MQFARLDFGEIDICSQLCARVWLRKRLQYYLGGGTLTSAHMQKCFTFNEDLERTSLKRTRKIKFDAFKTHEFRIAEYRNQFGKIHLQT